MLNNNRRRQRMVAQQLVRRGVRDPGVLSAMREVPREAFVAKRLQAFAYDDAPVPIKDGQTLSQPYVVAWMIAAAAMRPGERVLEVGAGSGYAAAVMSRIVDRVYAIERHDGLAKLAAARLRHLGYTNVEVHTGDGTRGWPSAAPFDAIVVSAGGPTIPPTLKDQLAIGGRLVIPVGDTPHQQCLLKVTRLGMTTFEQDSLGAVRFVPLIGEQGWSEADAPDLE